MPKKSYGLENVSYRDTERTEDYLLVREPSASTFNFPKNVHPYSYMFPAFKAEFYATETLEERTLAKYTKGEVDDLIQDFTIDVTDFINGNVSAISRTVELNRRNGMTLITSENIVEVNTESEG